MNLIIVESPTKARTIGRFLGDDYKIEASMGHLVDLPKSTLGVDVEHNFSPEFSIVSDKSEIVSKLQNEAKKADTIILATDPDREGEAIAYHISEILPISNTTNKQIKRIVFHEITEEAIKEALRNPRSIDQHLVEAQTARRILDRLVGYKLSPLLWKKVRRGLSAGRVQSVALRLIVEREREIEKFKKEEYWTIEAMLAQPSSDPVGFELIEINREKIEMQEKFDLYDGEYRVTKTTLISEEQAKNVEEDIKTKEFQVNDVLQKETRRSPHAPFTTSTLQQEAARQLGFSAKRTMSVAQKLYEEGLITYHRTDSVVISSGALSATRDFIQKQFGEKYLPDSPRVFKTKQKLAQEAHEAIRSTDVNFIRQVGGSNFKLGRDLEKLYELIWRRVVASQMAEAVIESTTVLVDSQIQSSNLKVKSEGAENHYRFKANGSVLVFDGFLKVNPQALMDKKLPQYKSLERLNLTNINAEKHETPPPPRYNDASLIATLEEKGIGRPSTYAPIISTIEARQYVEKTDGRFVPTPVGVAVNDFLVTNFSDIDDIPFTAEMEDKLDEIAHKQREWIPMIREFYVPFEKKLENVEDAARVKIEVEKTDEKCEKCGALLVVRIGRFGKFLSCSTFPKCDFTKPFVEKTNFTCPKDGGTVIIKKTKKGRRFYGCSNYPACDFAAWKISDIKPSNLQGDTLRG